MRIKTYFFIFKEITQVLWQSIHDDMIAYFFKVLYMEDEPSVSQLMRWSKGNIHAHNQGNVG